MVLQPPTWVSLRRHLGEMYTYCSEDSECLASRANFFKSEVTLPPSLFKTEDLFSSCTWKQVQYLADIFWRRWSGKYLPLLELRQTWVRPQRNLTIGDVVLVATESSQQNSWLIGRIVETFPDGRGFVDRLKCVPR